MAHQGISSKLLDEAVQEISRLPGIGKKSALRIVLYLLKQDINTVNKLGQSIIKMRNEIVFCAECHNISDKNICNICADSNRDKSQVCVVENIRDVMAIENTMQYKGVYHVLGGIISPMDGIGPSDLRLDTLVHKVSTGFVKEVIIALSTTMEGDTTSFYLYRKLSPFTIKITTPARGLSIGDELEFADEVTLGRSLINRTLFESR